MSIIQKIGVFLIIFSPLMFGSCQAQAGNGRNNTDAVSQRTSNCATLSVNGNCCHQGGVIRSNRTEGTSSFRHHGDQHDGGYHGCRRW